VGNHHGCVLVIIYRHEALYNKLANQQNNSIY
jgi:hypothetical protein